MVSSNGELKWNKQVGLIFGLFSSPKSMDFDRTPSMSTFTAHPAGRIRNSQPVQGLNLGNPRTAILPPALPSQHLEWLSAHQLLDKVASHPAPGDLGGLVVVPGAGGAVADTPLAQRWGIQATSPNGITVASRFDFCPGMAEASCVTLDRPLI